MMAMSLNERYEEIAAAIDKVMETKEQAWASAAKALVKQLIQVEVPHAENFKKTFGSPF